MKSLVIALVTATLTLSGVSAFAGDGAKEGGNGPNKMVRKLDRIVELSDTQKTDIATLIKNAGLGGHKAKQDKQAGEQKHKKPKLAPIDVNDPNYDALVQERAASMPDQVKERYLKKAQLRKAIHDVLTPEQQQRLAEHKAAQKAKRQNS